MKRYESIDLDALPPPAQKKKYANDVPETIQDLKPCLETNTCGRFDAANQSGQGTAYVYYWRSMLRQPNQRSLEHILCFKSHRCVCVCVERERERRGGGVHDAFRCVLYVVEAGGVCVVGSMYGGARRRGGRRESSGWLARKRAAACCRLCWMCG